MFLSPLRQLDRILEILENSEQQVDIDYIALNAENEVSLNTIILVLDKLIKDTYANKYQINELDSPYTKVLYSITFEGSAFIQQGGYVNESESIATEKERIEFATSFQLEQSRTLNRLTFWIALASGIAAVYYLYFLIQNLCSCEFVWQK
jgi:hypothetical protein